eukprot:1158242-Pelagomonas_calceolata.AAC.4
MITFFIHPHLLRTASATSSSKHQSLRGAKQQWLHMHHSAPNLCASTSSSCLANAEAIRQRARIC